MKSLIIVVFCLISVNSISQEINFEWNKIFGNTGWTSGLSLACDTSGFIYASGTFEGVINYNGTTFTSNGGKDGYLFKLDSNGNLLWSKQFANENDVKINSITIDNSNNLIVLGDYRVTVNFDTTFLTNNVDTLYSSNLFIAKYNIDGDLLWAKNTGGVAYDGNSLTVDLNNDILITGLSIDISLFDAITSINTLDSTLHSYPGGTYWEYYHPKVSFLAKYSQNGNMIWIEETGGHPYEIISDNCNNIIVTGNFIGDTYFNGTLVSEIGFETTYLAQYTSNGNLNWVKTSGGSANWNSGYGLEVDSANNIYQSGQILGNDIEFNGNISVPFAGTDAFITKYDVNGDLIWYELIGTPTTMSGQNNFNSGNSLKIDKNGDILFLGYFMDTLTFGASTLKSNGAPDLILLKFKSNGDIISSSQYSDYGWVEGIDLDIDNDNDIYLTGMTSLNTWNSIDPNYAFICKINETIPTSPLSIKENISSKYINIYPNPSYDLLQFKTDLNLKKAPFEINNLAGKQQLSGIIEDGIDISNLPQGMYIISVFYHKGISNIRFVKK